MRLVVLSLQGGQLCAAQKLAGVAASVLRLEGSERPIPCPDETALKNALIDLDLAEQDQLSVIADRSGRALWRKWLSQPAASVMQGRDWELRRLEALPSTPVAGRHANPAPALAELLASEDLGAEYDVARARLEAEIAREGQSWQAERERLLAEIAALTAQRDALRKADAERLATYLPALYEHVFSVVPPTDLALLCGVLEPPAVPNPWPEPAPETLRKLQADFLALPERLQREIVAFAQNLPQAPRLNPRAEMRELLHSLTPRAAR